MFVWPRPQQRELSTYYAGNYYEKPGLVFGAIQALRKNRFSGLSIGTVLDIGCGSGTFLRGMNSVGWKCFGTEVSEASKKFTKSLKMQGIKISYGDPTEIKCRAESFDLVTFWHVLEHLGNPERYLKHSRRILKKGGLIFIAVPNIESMSFRLWGPNWLHFDVPRHLQHFSPATLSYLLKKNGFAVKGISHFSLEFNPFGVMQSIYNSLGFEFNFLYRFMKKKARASGTRYLAQLVLTILTLPIVVPISLALAYLFSAIGAGDTIQVTATKE